MPVVLSVYAAILIVLHVFSSKKYSVFIEAVDRKDYPLKQFMPAALLLLDLSGYKHASGYDRRLLAKIVQLYGAKRSQDYLRIHWANKITYVLLSFFIVMAVGAGTKPDKGFVLFCAALVGGAVYFTDKDLNDRIKKRQAAIQIDFPDFLNRLILLINAGLTLTVAWERAAAGGRKTGPLYDELKAALADIKSGKPEQRAYEDFARRCRCSEITRFVSFILQNLRKGNSEIVSILRVHANECWEMRKNAARRLGEEASAKMLLPMTLMLIAMLLIVGVPAVLAIRGI